MTRRPVSGMAMLPRPKLECQREEIRVDGSAPGQRNGDGRFERQAAWGPEMKEVERMRPARPAPADGLTVAMNNAGHGVGPFDLAGVIDGQPTGRGGDQVWADGGASVEQLVEIETLAVDILVEFDRQIEAPGRATVSPWAREAREQTPHRTHLDRGPWVSVLPIEIDAVVIDAAVPFVSGWVETGKDDQFGLWQGSTHPRQLRQPPQHRLHAGRFVAMNAGAQTDAQGPELPLPWTANGACRECDGDERIAAGAVHGFTDRYEPVAWERPKGALQALEDRRIGATGVTGWTRHACCR
jgi:hypothetical protein